MNMALTPVMRSKLDQETIANKDNLSIFHLYSSQLTHIHIFGHIKKEFLVKKFTLLNPWNILIWPFEVNFFGCKMQNFVPFFATPIKLKEN